MALSNFSLPYSSGLTSPNWAATISPLQPHHATAVNSLLYGPVGHQESDEPPADISPQEYYKNDPYSPPSTQNHNQYKSKTNNNYLPPPSPSLQSPPSSYLSSSSSSVRTPQSLQTSSILSQRPTPQQQQQRTQRGPQYNQPSGGYLPTIQQPQQQQQTIRTYGEGSYGHPPIKNNIQQTSDYFNGYNAQKRTYQSQQSSNNNDPQTPSATPQPSSLGDYSSNDQGSSLTNNEGYPQRPPGFTRVQAGQGSRTQVHAVLDYDADENDDYYEQENEDNSSTGKSLPTVTPIQGPIFLKNGTVPVVPLFSYPTINNGTFVQIPIWWTALSVALGLDIRGDIIKGVPCVKRYHQLFCPTAGNSYPIDKIEKFIDDNKALMRRMYGDFEMQTTGGGFSTSKKRRRSTDEPDPFDIPGVPDMISKPDGKELEISDDAEFGETYFGKLRKKRQGGNFRGGGTGRRNGSEGVGAERPSGGPGNRRPNKNDRQNSNDSGTGRFDACESKVEIVTPYWASNSAGKIRAIVNTQHFEQAIHQEICTKVQTGRCNNDCGCEQKYKWHRLLAYDPDNDCKGIFMDWFLFPSCCVCRCSP